MTEEERQSERNAKKKCVSALSKIDIDSYNLGQLDSRLEDYARSLISAPDDHNLYELLALQRFFRFCDTYILRVDKVKQFILFYEFLKFEGPNGRQSYKMTPIQVFQFTNILGWYDKDGNRLTKEVCLFVPRKFSKTTSVCSLAIYDFLFGDDNAQAYTGANDYNQASLCFKEIRKVLKGLDTQRRFKSTRELITWRNGERNSLIRCVANSPDKLDGLNASTVIMDEYAQADSAELKTVLTTSMGMRTNPLTVVITTASDKPNSPFVDDLNAYKQILKGQIEDDSVFPHLFMPDVDDDEGDPHTWHKVHPHLGITVREEFYANEWAKAQRSANEMKGFRTKQLNIFETGSTRAWINGKTITSIYRDMDIDSIGKDKRGRLPETIVAVDLSVDNDLSAVSYFVYLYDEKKAHIHTDYYLPESVLEKHPNREMYKRWVDKKFLKLCKGRIIDYNQIVNDILLHGKNLMIKKIAYDPNRAGDFVNILRATGAEPFLEGYKQTNYYFTQPVEALPRLIEEKKITFNRNAINAYCFDNATLYVDRMENAKPMKMRENSKIDGVITACMALGTSMHVKRNP